jgi:hypothetical protein
MTRSQRTKAKGGDTWSSSARGERWRKQLAGAKLMTHRLRTNWVNDIWYDDLIMDSGGLLIRSVEFVGNQRPKALTQMDRACSSPDAKRICQDDVRFSPRLADVKAPSTTHQVEFVTYLFDTKLALIVTWGDLSQRSSLLGRILYVSLASHIHPVLSLKYIVCPVLFVSQRIPSQRFRAPPRYSLPRPPPRPPPFHCLAQVFTPCGLCWNLLLPTKDSQFTRSPILCRIVSPQAAWKIIRGTKARQRSRTCRASRVY